MWVTKRVTRIDKQKQGKVQVDWESTQNDLLMICLKMFSQTAQRSRTSVIAVSLKPNETENWKLKLNWKSLTKYNDKYFLS